MIPIPFDPMGALGGAAAKVVTDGLTAAMLSLWNSGLWLLQLVLVIEDAILTPDVTSQGPGAVLYRTTYWVAGALLLILLAVQIGTALARRDGRAMGRILVGAAQFALVWGGWLGFAAVLLLGSSALTHGLMNSLLKVDSWAAWKPWEPFEARDITDGVVAFVLGIMGLLLWLAAIGHVLMMLARAGALLVLAAVGPISAAGLVSDAGSSWFWKTLRWFLAAAFAPPVVVMMLGVGVQLTSGVASGLGKDIWASLGTAFVGVILICVSTFSPMALFKLLAFVDPGSTSGAALRAGVAASGGLQNVFSGSSGSSWVGAEPGQAASMDDTGRSAGENSAEAATTSRFSGALQGGMALLGPVGQVAAAGLGVMTKLGQAGASMGADLTNQMGVGHNNYPPDMSSAARRASSSSSADNSTTEQGTPSNPAPPDGPGGGSGQDPLDFKPPTPPTAAGDVGGGGGGGGSGGAAGAAGGRAAVAEAAEAAVVVL